MPDTQTDSDDDTLVPKAEQSEYQCGVCERSFYTEKGLHYHHERIHNADN